ncbi:MAG: tRNA sulfurtransferase [Candidatus Hadarchaeum sp.]|uniref:tRNA sulfurtransferase n=1 Tax=Candidatus Hadarchaeum sp. TaxID=2883567 RepID=UPI003D114795
MTSTVIVRYGELALKSEPVRRRFEKSLINSIERSLQELPHNLRTERGRIFVETTAAAKAVKILSQMPGITSVSPAIKTRAHLDDIKSKAIAMAKKILHPRMSFAVRTTRVGEHAFSSRDINVEIGSAILSRLKGLKVDLSHPDVEISIEVRGSDAYIFYKTVKGVGGLPVGTQGKTVAILSGGAKYAIAAFMMLKRGCNVALLFLNPLDQTTHQQAKRTISQAKKLSLFGADDSLLVFPFKKVLNRTLKNKDKKISSIIHKRCELRAASLIAKKIRAEAVVTGDDAETIKLLGLVNLPAIDAVCDVPVLRPLSFLDEDEIKDIGEKIGLRIKSAKSQPATGATVNAEEILKQENLINIEKVIEDASKKIRKIIIR